MNYYVVMNSKGEYGRNYKSGWISSKDFKMSWVSDIHQATLFTKFTERDVDSSEVIARIPAKETRIVEIIRESDK